MAAALKKSLGVSASLIAGDGGIFDVAVDGTLVFSKQQHGDFVDPPVIVALVKAHLESSS